MSGKSKERRFGFGIIVVLGKVASKAFPVLVKLLKGAKFGKLALGGASVAAYSILFSWQFALVIIGSLLFHEYGHVWAMKRHGLKVKGVYLIPFLTKFAGF